MAAHLAQTLHEKFPRSGKVCLESRLKGVFVEGLISSVRDNMRVKCRRNRQEAPLQLSLIRRYGLQVE